MRVVDTYQEVVANFARRKFCLSRWRAYTNAISGSLGQKVEADAGSYDMDKQVIPVIEYAMDQLEKMETTHKSFLQVTRNLEEDFIRVFYTNVDVDIVLYLGLCNGAGWATRIGEKRTILLGIEKIVELNWCDADTLGSLIHHELGHIWHDTVASLGPTACEESMESVWQLYREGVAMYCEQLLGGDETKYHLYDKEGLSWCEKNKGMLMAEFIRRVDRKEGTQDFFGDWCSYQGHSNVGYYLGCEFVKNLRQTHPLDEIAQMGVDMLAHELHRYAEQISCEGDG